MTRRPSLAELSAEQLLTRAGEYRRMALTAATAETRDALDRLAVRVAMLAARREIEERAPHVDPDGRSES